MHAVQAERMRARSDWFLSDPSGLVIVIVIFIVIVIVIVIIIVIVIVIVIDIVVIRTPMLPNPLAQDCV